MDQSPLLEAEARVAILWLEDQSSVEMSLVPSVCHQWKMEQLLAVELLLWILEVLALLSELHQQRQASSAVAAIQPDIEPRRRGLVQFRRGCWKVLNVCKHTVTGSPNGCRMEDHTCTVH